MPMHCLCYGCWRTSFQLTQSSGYALAGVCCVPRSLNSSTAGPSLVQACMTALGLPACCPSHAGEEISRSKRGLGCPYPIRGLCVRLEGFMGLSLDLGLCKAKLFLMMLCV